MFKAKISAAVMISILLTATACSKSDNEAPAAAADKPAEILMNKPMEFNILGIYSRTQFMEMDGNALLKKFPNIKINYYYIAGKDNMENGEVSIATVLATGMPIDIIQTSIGQIGAVVINTIKFTTIAICSTSSA